MPRGEDGVFRIEGVGGVASSSSATCSPLSASGFPSASATMAVMCVSGPNTCMSSPHSAPASRIMRSPSW